MKYKITLIVMTLVAITLSLIHICRLIEIENIRGKNSYYQIKKLTEYGLVKKIKRKKQPYYMLTEKFYDLLPDKTIKKLEDMKKSEFTKSPSDNVSK